MPKDMKKKIKSKAKPKDLGNGGARKIGDAILARKKAIREASKY